jgi:hypothetical protein
VPVGTFPVPVGNAVGMVQPTTTAALADAETAATTPAATMELRFFMFGNFLGRGGKTGIRDGKGEKPRNPKSSR